MAISVFDLFSIGIGPSSSHTVGPMRAARRFAEHLADSGVLAATVRVRSDLYGSLGATGHGHGSDKAVLLGLEGERPEDVDTERVDGRVAAIRRTGALYLLGGHRIAFDDHADLVLHRRAKGDPPPGSRPGHPNTMTFAALDAAGVVLAERTFYSLGGGFVLDGSTEGGPVAVPDRTPVEFPFRTAGDLLEHCERTGLGMHGVMRRNEHTWRDDAAIDAGLDELWRVMRDCVDRGCRRDGVLPGGLRVPRRAKALYDKTPPRIR